MTDLIKLLAVLPDRLATIITLLGICSVLSAVFPFLNRNKSKTRLKLFKMFKCFIMIFLLTFVCLGFWAKTMLIEVPYIYGMTYHSAVSTLERSGIPYECTTSVKNPNTDIVDYQSETAGTYILRNAKIVFSIKGSNMEEDIPNKDIFIFL